MFLYEHGFDTLLNEKVEEARAVDAEYQVTRRLRCANEVSKVTSKLAEYMILASYGTGMSVSAGLTGVSEVMYQMPDELIDCFETKDEYENANSQWSQYLHKDELEKFIKDSADKMIPKDWDLDWKHHVPEGYEKYAEDAEKVMDKVEKAVHFSDEEAQGYWDVLKESMTLY